ncbi:MAG: ABC transporter substrate-binding protein [bacterium]
MRRFIIGIILLISMSLLVNTVFGAEFPLKVRDDAKRTVIISRLPQRIISIAPANTEILFSLGLGDKVVGVTTWCDYPKEATKKEKIGDFQAPNVEKILSLKPDLVLATGGIQMPIVEKLQQLGITVYVIDPKTIDDVITTIYKVGHITGQDKVARDLGFNLKFRVSTVVSRVKKAQQKPKVFFELWHEPLMSVGPGSFVDDLIKKAGGINIAGNAKTPYPIFSLEELIKEDPDVIIGAASSMGAGPLNVATRPGWSSLKAVKEGRIFTIDDNIIFRPGPRLVDALEIIAKYLHPELFK